MRFVLGLVLPLMFLGTPVQAEMRECPGSATVIVYEDHRDYVMACSATAKTIGFFRELGFLTETPMMIAMKESVQLERGFAGEAYGQCDPALGYIEVLSYESHQRMKTRDQIFGVRLNAALHESIIVHEVAHALADIHFSVMESPGAVHEYIAYVAQIATLPEVTRRNVLRRHSVAALASEKAINVFNYANGPQVFGVRSYKHFKQQHDYNHYLRRLFSGDSQAYQQGLDI
ncbi:MAG: hypothetical protein OEU46_04620 [Alphaproteobacteria bacterium]|nr:hypothetical protein [Alphaproteobacteria bacterium]